MAYGMANDNERGLPAWFWTVGAVFGLCFLGAAFVALAFVLITQTDSAPDGRSGERAAVAAAPTATATASPTATALPTSTPTPTPTPTPAVCGLDSINRAALAVVRIQTPRGVGSGFLISGGVIVTNAHVVEGATTVAIQYADSTEGRGNVTAVSAGLDLALVTPASPPLAVLSWGDASSIQGEQSVVVIGFPLGLTGPPVLTRGSVSRVISSSGEQYVQTDAEVNQGNSGGPLIDDCGRVLGVVTLKVSGAGFAQSVRDVKPEVVRLLEGKPTGRAGASPTVRPGMSVSGRWLLLDSPTVGPDSGQTFSFTVDLQDTNGAITGSASGTNFVVTGTRDGAHVRVNFTRTDGSGYFDWQLSAAGTLVGTYEDYGAHNGGTSIGTRAP